jgi:AraC family transcriptional regulator of adaptative response/methylated-DNA-[protein]-cysteine methyltransferase
MTFDEKYEAVKRRDTSYEGIFFLGVKTTGIFCRPGCRARTPKPENVTFFSSPEEALLHGFRPCKLCHPMQPAQDTPGFVAALLKDLNREPFLRIRDRDLRERGLEPARVRRWFKKHHGMTFQAYQRMLRINTAFRKLEAGHSVTDTAFDVGFESLSGFNQRFQSVFGNSPGGEVPRQVINIQRLSAPLGPMYACATQEGICLLEFTNRRMLETEFTDLEKRLHAVILPGENPLFAQLKVELREYFAGARKRFEIPLHTPGSPFHRQVWEELTKIPFGETRTYGEQARQLGNPKAVRAVATANGKNRIALIIPCHRVIGKGGSLTGYAGGLARKRWLLNHERLHSGQKELPFVK